VQLNDPDIKKLAKWEPLHSGFGVDCDAPVRHLHAIMDRIRAAGLDAGISGGGLSANYVSFMVEVPRRGTAWTNQDQTHRRPVWVVQLSLLAPVGVYGKGELVWGFISGSEFASHPVLEPDDVADPDDPGSAVGSTIVRCVREVSPYELLTRGEVRRPLPRDVRPFEYCHTREPWDRLHHVLFSHTD
jgi:hypothetical protein